MGKVSRREGSGTTASSSTSGSGTTSSSSSGSSSSSSSSSSTTASNSPNSGRHRNSSDLPRPIIQQHQERHLQQQSPLRSGPTSPGPGVPPNAPLRHRERSSHRHRHPLPPRPQQPQHFHHLTPRKPHRAPGSASGVASQPNPARSAVHSSLPANARVAPGQPSFGRSDQHPHFSSAELNSFRLGCASPAVPPNVLAQRMFTASDSAYRIQDLSYGDLIDLEDYLGLSVSWLLRCLSEPHSLMSNTKKDELIALSLWCSLRFGFLALTDGTKSNCCETLLSHLYGTYPRTRVICTQEALLYQTQVSSPSSSFWRKNGIRTFRLTRTENVASCLLLHCQELKKFTLHHSLYSAVGPPAEISFAFPSGFVSATTSSSPTQCVLLIAKLDKNQLTLEKPRFSEVRVLGSCPQRAVSEGYYLCLNSALEGCLQSIDRKYSWKDLAGKRVTITMPPLFGSVFAYTIIVGDGGRQRSPLEGLYLRAFGRLGNTFRGKVCLKSNWFFVGLPADPVESDDNDEIVEKLALKMLEHCSRVNNAAVGVKPMSTPAPQLEEENDLVIGDVELSFLCPLTLTRIKHPSKGVTCKHLQVFDAQTFLTLNKVRDTIKCPVAACKEVLKKHELQIDELVLALLAKYHDQDKCLLRADGTDSKCEVATNESQSLSATGGGDADVIVIEDDDPIATTGKNEAGGGVQHPGSTDRATGPAKPDNDEDDVMTVLGDSDDEVIIISMSTATHQSTGSHGRRKESSASSESSSDGESSDEEESPVRSRKRVRSGEVIEISD
ncbi:hypothetical protein DFJ73DRAFT_857194 [Zopfochytrium polystomum]|nr:hypothetical protein DFJ73DRAFT_857194 [Zopfochytrium polystomum]